MKKLILILGANGIGKSTVSAELLRRLPNSAYIDSDWCRMMNPAQFTDETIAVNRKNILDLMINYFSCSTVQNVIFPYGLHGHRKQLLDDLLCVLRRKFEFQLFIVVLVCDEAENIQRMKADGRDEERIMRGVKNTRAIYDKLDYPKIKVTNLTVSETAEEILKSIGV